MKYSAFVFVFNLKGACVRSSPILDLDIDEKAYFVLSRYLITIQFKMIIKDYDYYPSHVSS